MPIIYANLNGVHLMPPSDAAQDTVANRMEENMRVRGADLPAPAAAPGAQDRGDESGELAEADAADGAAPPQKKAKRHKAAAPNPLAMQRPKKGAAAAGGGAGGVGAGVAKKARRKRASGPSGADG